MVQRLKRTIFPAIILLICLVGLVFVAPFKTEANAQTVQITYEADLTNADPVTNLPYDWALHGRSDVASANAPQKTANGIKLGSSSGGANTNYHGAMYRFGVGLGNVTDFTLEFKYKVTNSYSTDGRRWIGLLYHTQLNPTEQRLTGYMLGFRENGEAHQSTITNTSTPVFNDDANSKTTVSGFSGWNDYHTLIVEAQGNTVSHYLDNKDTLLYSYDITNTAYSSLLTPQVYGGFALIINLCEIEISSVKITATRDPQYNAKVAGDESPALTDYNTTGLKSLTNVCSEINSTADVNALSTSGAGSAIFYLGDNSTGSVSIKSSSGTVIDGITLGDIGGEVSQTAQSTYPKYHGVYPILYASNDLHKEILTTYLTAYKIQFGIMSDDPTLLKTLRETGNMRYTRGMLDWSGQTVAKNTTAWQNVVSTTNASHATLAVLSENDATPEAVDYIQRRGITVWVKQATYTDTDTVSIMATGAGGIISSNVAKTISARSLFNSDVNALSRTPLNIAHRGMSMGYYPNTVEGCKAAYAQGATHLEIDLYVTTDNYVMVMHDDPLYVVCDCHTVGGECTDYISDMTYEQTRNYKVVKESNEFLFPATELGAGVPIPTLNEMFDWATQNPDVLFYLELKPCDAGHGGGGTLETTYNQRLIDAITKCITDYDIADQIVFITSNADLARKAHASLPGIAMVSTTGDNILANSNYYLDYWADLNIGIDVYSGWANTSEFIALGYMPNYWTYDVVHRVNAYGYPVYRSYEAAIVSGVYGITNNFPYVFKNNAYSLYYDGAGITASSISELQANGVPLKYKTYAGEEKTVLGTLFSYKDVDGNTEATFKYTFTNDYGLQYTLYTSKYAVQLKSTELFVPTNFTVTFDTNGGSTIASQTVEEGLSATIPASPTKEGFTFVGWYADQNCTIAFNFNTAIIADTTIYAKWTENQGGNNQGGGSSSAPKGCGSFVNGEGLITLAVCTLLGGAFVAIKKKRGRQ